MVWHQSWAWPGAQSRWRPPGNSGAEVWDEEESSDGENDPVGSHDKEWWAKRLGIDQWQSSGWDSSGWQEDWEWGWWGSGRSSEGWSSQSWCNSTSEGGWWSSASSSWHSGEQKRAKFPESDFQTRGELWSHRYPLELRRREYAESKERSRKLPGAEEKGN